MPDTALHETDVCIVGAGPGGVCAALTLSQLGIPCTVIDQAVFPRDKVGGDVLPGIIMRALHEVDPHYVADFQQQPFLRAVKGTQLYAPNGHSLTVDYRNINISEYRDIVSCYAARRFDFDHYLVELLQHHAGVTLIEGQRIDTVEREPDGLVLQNRTGNFRIKTRIAIIASGAASGLVKQLSGIQIAARHRGVGLRAYFTGVDHGEGERYSQLYFTRDLLPGIFYVTPLNGGLTNVNLGTREDVRRKKELNLKNLLKQTIRHHPQIAPRFRQAELIGSPRGWSLPFATYRQCLYGDRFMLVGDAGSLIDFVTGNGIGSAMFSGVYAARQAARCLRQGKFDAATLAPYQQAVDQKLAAQHQLGRKLAPFFGLTPAYGIYRRLLNLLIKRAGSSELITELLYSQHIEKDLRSFSFYRKFF